MGITFVYQNAKASGAFWSSLPYFSISLSLDILLTIMIVARLILHTRNTRTALGMSGIGGLCKAIIMMLVESCALYAVNSLLLIGTLGAGNVVSTLFITVIGEIQVRASPQPQSLDWLSDAATDWTGYRSAAHHLTNC